MPPKQFQQQFSCCFEYFVDVWESMFVYDVQIADLIGGGVCSLSSRMLGLFSFSTRWFFLCGRSSSSCFLLSELKDGLLRIQRFHLQMFQAVVEEWRPYCAAVFLCCAIRSPVLLIWVVQFCNYQVVVCLHDISVKFLQGSWGFVVFFAFFFFWIIPWNLFSQDIFRLEVFFSHDCIFRLFTIKFIRGHPHLPKKKNQNKRTKLSKQSTQ